MPLLTDRDCIEPVDCPGQYGHFNNIDPYNPIDYHAKRNKTEKGKYHMISFIYETFKK